MRKHTNVARRKLSLLVLSTKVDFSACEVISLDLNSIASYVVRPAQPTCAICQICRSRKTLSSMLILVNENVICIVSGNLAYKGMDILRESQTHGLNAGPHQMVSRKV